MTATARFSVQSGPGLSQAAIRLPMPSRVWKAATGVRRRCEAVASSQVFNGLVAHTHTPPTIRETRPTNDSEQGYVCTPALGRHSGRRDVRLPALDCFAGCLRTRKRRIVTAPDRVLSIGSRSILSGAANLVPSPSRTGIT